MRSSGSGEDGANHSFAGVFESVIDVDHAGLEAAIARVQASFEAARVSSYGFNAGAGNILIQRMVDAEYAGVLFTRDPAAGGLMMVEMVQGTAENLVSGTVRPQSFRFGRVSKKPFGKDRRRRSTSRRCWNWATSPSACSAVRRTWNGPIATATSIWCRAATSPGRSPAMSMRRRCRTTWRAPSISPRGAAASPIEVVFAKNELSEMLPRPTPLSLSLMEELWAAGGSVDLAARELGLRYQVGEGAPYLATIFGRLYVDKREEQSRALVISAMASRRLMRDAARIEGDFRERFLPQLASTSCGCSTWSTSRSCRRPSWSRRSSACTTASCSTPTWRWTWSTSRPGFYLDRARRVLSADAIDPSSLLGHIPETHEAKAIAEISNASTKSRRWLLLKNFGHRAVLDYELAEPRYAEDLNTLNRMIAGRVPRRAAGLPEHDGAVALAGQDRRCRAALPDA